MSENKLKNKNREHKVNDKRRNLAKASATLPFLMSFSRPLWAAGCEPSDLQSGNLSVRPGKPNCFGMGLPISFFLANSAASEYWVNYAPSHKFNLLFDMKTVKVNIGGSIELNPTLLQVLQANDSDITTIATPSVAVGAEAKLAIAAVLSIGISPHYGKVLPTDSAATVMDVLGSFQAGTVIADFGGFHTV